MLRDLGLQAGDRVTLHMPMVPELPVTMLACARLGVVHSQVFAGFSGGACGGRIADSGSKVLITMDAYYRSGDLLDHKVKADEAVEAAREEGQEIEKVLVWRRSEASTRPRPRWWRAGTSSSTNCSPTTGAPSSSRSHAGRGAAVPDVHQRHHRAAQGLPALHRRLPVLRGRDVEVLPGHPPDDTYWCMADIGWITGHSYIVYGPLALGATTVIYEGTPNYPDAGAPGGSPSSSG